MPSYIILMVTVRQFSKYISAGECKLPKFLLSIFLVSFWDVESKIPSPAEFCPTQDKCLVSPLSTATMVIQQNVKGKTMKHRI